MQLREEAKRKICECVFLWTESVGILAIKDIKARTACGKAAIEPEVVGQRRMILTKAFAQAVHPSYLSCKNPSND